MDSFILGLAIGILVGVIVTVGAFSIAAALTTENLNE